MFGLISEKKYKKLLGANELLRNAIVNLEKALRNEKLVNAILEGENEDAINDSFNMASLVMKKTDENDTLYKELNQYREAAEKIADIVLSLPWNNMNDKKADEYYDTISTCGDMDGDLN